MVRGDGLPGDVSRIPIRPVWQLSDAEERRTRQGRSRLRAKLRRWVPARGPRDVAVPSPRPGPRPKGCRGCSTARGRRWRGSGLRLVLGAAHAVQPGHGKALVAAASVGERGGWLRGAVLALTVTRPTSAGVLAVAVGLWATRSSRYPDINRGLAHGAGFVIAASESGGSADTWAGTASTTTNRNQGRAAWAREA